MKILMIPSTMLPFPPVKGGAVQNLMKLYVEYNEKTGNHELTVLSIYAEEAVSMAQMWNHCNVDFIRLPSFLFRIRENNKSLLSRVGFSAINYFYLRILVRLIKEKYLGYDEIILDNTPQFALAISKVFRKKVCIHIYNDYLNSKTKNISNILNSSSKIITVSDYISNCVLQTNLISKDRVITLHNGVELSMFGTDKSKLRRSDLRYNMGIPDNDFVFIFVARLVPEKGIKELIQAFNSIDCEQVHLVVVGNKLYSGDITDPFLIELRSLAEKKKDRIHFTGYIDYSILPDYYTMADAGVLPSLYEEPFALAAIEYMASGLPIILSDAGGFPEMATGETAIIAKRGDGFVEELSSSMKRLLEDKELRQKLSDNGLIKSREFSSQLYCERLEKIIEKLQA